LTPRRAISARDFFRYHRYPSEALQHVADTRAPELRTRARRLHARVLENFLERARDFASFAGALRLA
jgi:hypothetical protein